MEHSDKDPVIKFEELNVSEFAHFDTETNKNDVVHEVNDRRTSEPKLSELQSLMNFIKSNIGTGMLSMPVVLRYCGLWAGFCAILLAGAVATYLMTVLVRVARSVAKQHGLDRSKMDYPETVFNVFKYGPQRLRKWKGKIKHTVNVFLLITQIGFSCIYTLFLTENIRYFLRSFFPGLWLNFYFVGFVICLLLIPMCLCSDMRVFAHLSALANLATLLGTALIFAYLFSSGLQPITSFPAIKDTQGVLIGFSVAMCAFEGISLILPIENKMANPEGYIHPVGVLNTGMTVVICVNTAIAFFGYLRFGDEAQGSITLNVPERPYWFAPVKPLFIVAIVISYLVQFYVPVTIFARLMEKLSCHRHASDRRRDVNIKLMRISLVFLAYLMVITIPRLELMISLIGAFASSVLAFVLPPILEIVHLWHRRRQISRFWLTVFFKHFIFILLGLLTFVGGTVATLIQLVHSFGSVH